MNRRPNLQESISAILFNHPVSDGAGMTTEDIAEQCDAASRAIMAELASRYIIPWEISRAP